MKMVQGRPKARADSRGRHPMLARTRFRNDPRLAHAHRKQDLPDAIVDLVCAGVVQLIALEPDLRTAQLFRQARREIERGGPTDIMFEQVIKFGPERRVCLRFGIAFFQIENERHQRFGDVASAKLAKMPAFVGQSAEGIGCVHGLWPYTSLRAKRSNPERCRKWIAARRSQ
jgi:hypothetical protein